MGIRTTHMATNQRQRKHRARAPAPSEERGTLLSRARRLRRRGEQRRAMLLLRDAAYSDRQDAALWTTYADQCLRAGKREQADQALVHAIWLRERQHDAKRAGVTRLLLEDLRHAA